jgi:Zn-finger nucleic acid-binding protein
MLAFAAPLCRTGEDRMKCPVCDATLVMTERQGVEIDYCPECRGIWLDRGELDKLIELSSGQLDGPIDSPDSKLRRHDEPKESWIGRLLDFDFD